MKVKGWVGWHININYYVRRNVGAKTDSKKSYTIKIIKLVIAPNRICLTSVLRQMCVLRSVWVCYLIYILTAVQSAVR